MHEKNREEENQKNTATTDMNDDHNEHTYPSKKE